MRAEKVTLTITVEVLDIASAPGIIYEAIDFIGKESDGGFFEKTDGDNVTWKVVKKAVEF